MNRREIVKEVMALLAMVVLLFAMAYAALLAE